MPFFQEKKMGLIKIYGYGDIKVARAQILCLVSFDEKISEL